MLREKPVFEALSREPYTRYAARLLAKTFPMKSMRVEIHLSHDVSAAAQQAVGILARLAC